MAFLPERFSRAMPRAILETLSLSAAASGEIKTSEVAGISSSFGYSLDLKPESNHAAHELSCLDHVCPKSRGVPATVSGLLSINPVQRRAVESSHPATSLPPPIYRTPLVYPN